jgi:molecular chaperone DnaK
MVPIRGGLSVRANVADREDLRLVPGEYLHDLDPSYFDSRRFPPQEQVLEKLYYQPCVGCGRASNDPL